jgi:S-disulfanyl-L-cysteine oxidoreductase SoxD
MNPVPFASDETLTWGRDRGCLGRFRRMLASWIRGRSSLVVVVVASTLWSVGLLAHAAQQGGASAAPDSNAQTARSVWDGVYTEEQAGRGKELYSTHCLSCHGETLEGNGPVRPLTGPDFAANWNGLTMGDMLERTRTTMPMDKPGTLSRQQVADVLAFVLSVNKLPAGKAELPRQSELLSTIKFLAQKPSSDPRPVPRQQ